jgi:hypothetical protein
VPSEAVTQIKAALNGKAAIHTYPEVGHAFTNVDREGTYNAKSALLANTRTVDFLAELQQPAGRRDHQQRGALLRAEFRRHLWRRHWRHRRPPIFW